MNFCQAKITKFVVEEENLDFSGKSKTYWILERRQKERA